MFPQVGGSPAKNTFGQEHIDTLECHLPRSGLHCQCGDSSGCQNVC